MDPFQVKYQYIQVLSISGLVPRRTRSPKIPYLSLKTDKMCTGQRPSTRSKPKKIQFLIFRVKNSKNRKNTKITYKNFFLIFSSSVNQYVKMILMVVLHSWPVEKKTKILQLDLQNGPRKSIFPSYIYTGPLAG